MAQNGGDTRDCGHNTGTADSRMHEDCQELVDEVSALLGTPALLESRDFVLLAFGAHEADDNQSMDPVRTRSILRRRSTATVREYFESFGIARARGPVRIPPRPSAGLLTGRICVPVRQGGVVYGYIWLLDDGAVPVTDPRLSDAMAAAGHVGGLLAAAARGGARAGELLRALLTAAPGQRAAAASELATVLGAAVDGPLSVVAVLSGGSGDTGGGLDGLARLPGVAASCTMPLARGDAPVEAGVARAVLVRLRSTASAAPARAVAEQLLRSASVEARAGRRGPSGGAGISAARRGVDDLPAAWCEAVSAARAGAADSSLGDVAEWGDLGPYRLLTALPHDEPDAAARPLLLPAHRALARTAEAFLDHAGQAGRTAAALGIHRQTLYYRLARVERLTGLDLDDGRARLLLHMALKAARLGGAFTDGPR